MSSQTKIDFAQVDTFIIEDLDTLKVISDPLRLQVLEITLDHAHTVKQIAAKLDIPASKLYYHINLLDKHDLVAVASTRIVSGIVEKSYRSAARSFRVQRGLLNPTSNPDSNVNLVVDVIFDGAKSDIKDSVAYGLVDLSDSAAELKLSIMRAMTRLTPDEAIEFQQRLNELIDDFNSRRDNRNVDEQAYALMFALYPTVRGARPTPNGDERT